MPAAICFTFAPRLLGEIDEDRVRIRDDDVPILQDRHLSEGVELQEFGALVGTGLEIDLDQFVGQPEKRGEQAGAVRVARQGVMMEFHVQVPICVGRADSRAAPSDCSIGGMTGMTGLGTSSLRKMKEWLVG